MNITQTDLTNLKTMLTDYNERQHKNNYHALKVVKKYAKVFMDMSVIALNKINDHQLFMDCYSLGYSLDMMLEALHDDKDYYPPEIDMSGFDNCLGTMHEIINKTT